MVEPRVSCPLCSGDLDEDGPTARVPAEVAYGRPIHGTTVSVHVWCKEALDATR